MTERALPAIGVGARARPIAADRPAIAPGDARTARPLTVRREAILSAPARAGMLFGVSAAVYAVTLAGVAGLQAESEAAASAARAPHLDTLTQTRAANDALEAKVLAADAQVRALAGTYATIGTEVEAYQARLDALALLVADVEGSAAALPDRIRLPSVSMRARSPRVGAGAVGRRPQGRRARPARPGADPTAEVTAPGRAPDGTRRGTRGPTGWCRSAGARSGLRCA